MSAESNNIRDSLVDQLSSFDARLDEKLDDVRLLADIQDGIGSLIGAAGGNEAEIRRVLQERYDSGKLRRETFQLVKSMLDRFVTENIPTAGRVDPQREPPPTPPAQEEIYVQTIAEAASELLDDAVAPAGAVSLGESAVLDADSRVQIGSVLRDRFMLQERVAGGSMGVVYKALDRRLAEADTDNPYVAVKVLSPQLSSNVQALRALQQEGAKGRCLTHQNIVRFIDLDRDDDLFFIVMEWLDGRTLADILDTPETSKLDPQRAFEIVGQLGKALAYAHRCGIVHADVKPGNVMILPSGDVKLLDFGVARVRQKQLELAKDFDPGVLGLLTPAYSSMQVLTGEDPTPADDVFSLACLLYRLLAGYRVFGPRNAAEAAEAGMNPQRPQGLDNARWKVLKKALSYSRVTRFETVQEFVDALNLSAADTIQLVVPPRRDVADELDQHGSGRWLAGMVILLGLGGFAAYQYGYLDPYLEPYLTPTAELVELPEPEPATVVPVTELPATVGEDIGDPAGADATVANGSNRSVPDTDAQTAASEPAGAEIADIVEIAVEPSQFDGLELAQNSANEEVVAIADLPPADLQLQIDLSSSRADRASLALLEGGEPVSIEIVRKNIGLPLSLRLEEAGFSGNRSPWAGGQFTMSNDGYIDFAEGQDRARIQLSMTDDPMREADQQSTLRLRESDAAATTLATITINLQDDDQRAFEATMPENTVAFATSQVAVRERDPAVQIDIMRYNPDDTRLTIYYRLRDITATQGEDYFAPGNATIEFGPGQRTARLLIPLVQDVAPEDNEAFRVELLSSEDPQTAEVFADMAVIIRDDD